MSTSMNTPLLHVLGGGPWQVPTIRLAKSMGLRVLVTDYYQDRPGYALADFHEVVDITDLDATLDIARDYGVTGIICDTTDVGVPTAAYVAEKLGLPGMTYDVAVNFTNKARMRDIARIRGVPTPDYKVVDKDTPCELIAPAIQYPVIVKPVDSQSGKGVTRVVKRTDLCDALQHALDNSRSKTVILESVIDGIEIIVDSFMLDGQSVILGIGQKLPHRLEPTVSERITYSPLIDQDAFQRIREVNQVMLHAMGLRWGISHAEYIVRAKDIIPIDIAARGGGCMIYTHILPYISQTNVNREMIRLALGERPVIKPGIPKAGNIDFFHLPEGIIDRWHGLEAALNTKGVLGIHLNLKPGDVVPELRNKDHRAGYIVAGAENVEDAITACLSAKAKLRVHMRGREQSITIS